MRACDFLLSEMMTFFQGDRRVTEQESVVEQTLRSAIITDLYLKSQISVVVHVLEADGYVLYMHQLHYSKMVLLHNFTQIDFGHHFERSVSRIDAGGYFHV